MSRDICWRLSLVAVLVGVLSSFSRKGEAGEVDDGQAFAKRALAIADAVLEHHVAPPTRQEMVLAALRELYDTAKLDPPAGLAKIVSEAEGAAALEKLLAQAGADATAKTAPEDIVQERALGAMLRAVGGETLYLRPGDLRVTQQIAGNRYEGIGIRLAYSQEEELPFVDALFARGPLDAAGGLPKDRILTIDGKDAHGLGLGEVVDLLRGERGSDISLVVKQPEGDPRTLTFKRDVIPFELVTGVRRGDDGQWRHAVAEGVAYVRLATIGASTLMELRTAERKARAEDCKALIVDLRFTGGGNLHYANVAADAFLTSGVIGKASTTKGVEEFTATDDAIFRDWPLVVLVNAQTRGDAEWFCAALKHNGRAVLVGERTSGDISFQTPIPLPEEQGGLLLTTAIAVGDHVRPAGHAADQHAVPPRAVAADQENSYGLEPDHALSLDGDSGRAMLAAFSRQGVKTGEDDTLPMDAQIEKAIEELTSRVTVSE